jgi:hypothetical protein
MLKRSSISGLYHNWTRCTCQWSNVEKQARGVAKKLCHNDLKGTDGWLSQCKWRFEIKFNKASGKKDIAEQWKSTMLQNLVQKFCTDDIYYADETGLFYCAMSDGSLSYKHATLSG